MRHIKFPVLKGKHVVFPRDHICPWCRKKKLSDSDGMAILNAGAMRPIAPQCYAMADDDVAFMSLVWHGNDSPANSHTRNEFATVEIADLVDSGQFEFYFCSTDCLRAFLNYCVDELERRRTRSRRANRRQTRITSVPLRRAKKRGQVTRR